MKDGWINVYSADLEFKAKLAEDILKQHDIVSHIMMKPNSAIPSIGNASLLVPEAEAEKAIEILKKEKIITEE
ncbi:MAG: hypothetical protein Sapg2KO_12150 [Saprospiraceae bacterium]